MKRLSADTEAKLSALSRQAYRYWLSLAPGSGGLPGRQHVNPVEIPRLLPNLCLIDVRPDPGGYRFRLIGTAVVAATHEEFTGRTLDQVLRGEAFAQIRSLLDRIVATGQPEWQIGLPLLNADKRWDLTERLCLPLAKDGETVDMLFCISSYHRRSSFPSLFGMPRPEPVLPFGRRHAAARPS